MKRYASLLLIVCMLIALLSACGGEQPGEQPKSYTFKKGTLEIAVDADATPILAALGAYKAYDATPSCAFAGEDKIYVYDGFQLQTYQKTAGGADYVYSVVLTDDTYTTSEGIAIGSTSSLVLEKYGTPDEKTDTSITYSTARESLRFLIKDGSVTSVQYLKNV